MRATWGVALVLGGLALQSGTVWAQIGYAGGATEGDFARLARDVGRFVETEQVFNVLVRDRVQQAAAWERQRQLLGSDEAVDVIAMAAEVRRYWTDNVLKPAFDIAGNPAASCPFVQYMLERMLELQKNAQVLGLENAELGGEIGDSDKTFKEAADRGFKRCIEEAFDECMATGNGKVFLDMMLKWRGQIQMSAAFGNDSQERFAYLFRRCTVYQLTYHLEFQDVGEEPTSGVADGTFTLLFEFGDEAGPSLAGVNSGQWKAPRPEDAFSPDIVFSSLNCGPDTISCELEDPPVGGNAHARIFLKRRYISNQRILMKPPGLAEPAKTEQPNCFVIEQPVGDPPGTKIEAKIGGQTTAFPAAPTFIATEICEDGADQIGLYFGPPVASAAGSYRPGFGQLYTIGGPGTWYYYFATSSNLSAPPQISEWARHGYPVLFTAMPVASSGTYRVRGTDYQVVHRPDLYPPEWIDGRFEIERSRIPEAPRVLR